MLKKLFFVLFSLLVFQVSSVYSKANALETYTKQDTFKIGNPADAVILPGTANTDLTIFEMIQGKVAGVWITGGPNFYRIRIRGASRPPLVVLDGMQFTSYSDYELNSLLQSIAPADVARIEVVKGIGGSVPYRNTGSGILMIYTKP